MCLDGRWFAFLSKLVQETPVTRTGFQRLACLWFLPKAACLAKASRSTAFHTHQFGEAGWQGMVDEPLKEK